MTDAAAASRETVGRLMRRATYASLTVAVTLMAVKFAAWLTTDSVSLLSSLIDSLLDGAASLVNLLAVRQALTPPDREHRFGHGKVEPLATLGQSAFIAGSAVLLLIQAVQRLVHPTLVGNTEIGLGVMIFAIAVTLVLVTYQRRVVRRTGSVLVDSDSFHYRADLVLNFSVLASLFLTAETGNRAIDPVFGGVIALWIIWGAWRVASKAVVQLMDHELPDEDRQRIRDIVMKHAEVKAIHDMKTRAAGPDSFIQIHLEMDGDLRLTEAHVVADAVEADILQAFPRAEVIIHQDPEGVQEGRATYAAH